MFLNYPPRSRTRPPPCWEQRLIIRLADEHELYPAASTNNLPPETDSFPTLVAGFSDTQRSLYMMRSHPCQVVGAVTAITSKHTAIWIRKLKSATRFVLCTSVEATQELDEQLEPQCLVTRLRRDGNIPFSFCHMHCPTHSTYMHGHLDDNSAPGNTLNYNRRKFGTHPTTWESTR